MSKKLVRKMKPMKQSKKGLKRMKLKREAEVGIRVKGGIKQIENKFCAVYLIWTDVKCKGEPLEEILSPEFSTFEKANEYYKEVLSSQVFDFSTALRDDNDIFLEEFYSYVKKMSDKYKENVKDDEQEIDKKED